MEASTQLRRKTGAAGIRGYQTTRLRCSAGEPHGGQDGAGSNGVAQQHQKRISRPPILAMDEKVKQAQQLKRCDCQLQRRGSKAVRSLSSVCGASATSRCQTDYEENHKKQEFTDTAKSIEEHKAGENLDVLDRPAIPRLLPSPPAANRGHGNGR